VKICRLEASDTGYVPSSGPLSTRQWTFGFQKRGGFIDQMRDYLLLKKKWTP